MASIEILTAVRMLAIEASAIVAGVIQGDNLILTRRDGTTFSAGNVRGPKGDKGDVGGMTSSAAGGDLDGFFPNPTIRANSIVHDDVATANRDGLATVPSMRTLGTGAQQAAAGNHTHPDIPKFKFGVVRHTPTSAGQKLEQAYTNLWPVGFFSTIPSVILTPDSGFPENITGYAAANRTLTGFSVIATRSTLADTNYHYLAIGT